MKSLHILYSVQKFLLAVHKGYLGVVSYSITIVTTSGMHIIFGLAQQFYVCIAHNYKLHSLPIIRNQYVVVKQ